MRHLPVGRLAAVVALAVISTALTVASSEPAAAQTGGFGDVPDGAYFSVPVATLADQGVFAGTECDDGFCPGGPIDRKTMAVWIVRVLDGQDPPPVTQTRFNDVDGASFYAPFIERMVELGVTRGCGDGSGFCPDGNVTRAQLAAFLSRGYQLPDGPDPGFADVPSDIWYAADVARLVASQITLGCGDGSVFCPEQDTTRGQMATFLHRAENRGEDPDEDPDEAPQLAYKAIDSGWEHACAIRSDDTVTCWGNNNAGRATDPDGEFTSVSVGMWHGCGLRPDRTIACWGYSSDGQTNPPAGEFIEVSAGGVHSCGLRTDGTAVCWGSNRVRKAEAPQGEFLSVAAGGEHSCGLRSDGTVTCWGSDGSGQRNVPEGEFHALSTGDRHSCAIRTDDTVTCWGSSFGDTIVDPDGQFLSVSAGTSHSCGVRTDNSIVCWGSGGREGLTDPPIGDFTAVSAGQGHSCGMRTDGTVACWGDTGYDPTDAPGGSHIAVSVGDEHSCGLRADGTITCWGDPGGGRTYPPLEAFTDVSAGRVHTCGVLADNTVACWGANHVGQSIAPKGQFSAVATGGWHTCGLRTDGFVHCWGLSSKGRTDSPVGKFSALESGGQHTCAIRTDGVVICWGEDRDGQTDAPSGTFTDVAAGRDHSCGVRQDQAVVCWGKNDDGQTDAPSGTFTDVAAGRNHSCGVRTDGTIVCWGAIWWGKSSPPQGAFTEVAVDGQQSCGLRTDGAIVCWGIDIIPLPSGAERVIGPRQPDPSVCRPYGPTQFWSRGVSSAGFPLPEDAAKRDGTLRVAVLFIDFPDIRAGHSARREAAAGLPTAERYLEAASYGKLDVQFEPINVWLRASKNHDQYLSKTAVGDAITTLIDKEAVALGDVHDDFRGVDIAMIVMPSTHFAGGNATGTVRSPDGTLGTTRVNTFPLEEPQSHTTDWGIVAAHELIHNLGLLDLYPYDESLHEQPEAPSGRAWIHARIGLMGMQANYVASARSRSIAHTWRWPSGQKADAYHYSPQAREMLAWTRWQLEWLDPAQVLCITDERATVSLHPVAEPGEGIAMAAIPLSGHEVLVIESRRKTNFDESYEFTFPGDIRTTLPSLLEEGVLVYVVDARVPGGELPIRFAGDDGDGGVDSYPILRARESITVRGYTITVASADRDTHTVSITKAGS